LLRKTNYHQQRPITADKSQSSLTAPITTGKSQSSLTAPPSPLARVKHRRQKLVIADKGQSSLTRVKHRQQKLFIADKGQSSLTRVKHHQQSWSSSTKADHRQQKPIQYLSLSRP
jgi:hypothetical protein